jgi:hypothetical protein
MKALYIFFDKETTSKKHTHRSRNEVGYLVCCLHSKHYYCNRQFLLLTKEYTQDEAQAHDIVNEMFGDLISIFEKDGSQIVQRSLPQLYSDGIEVDCLSVVASLLHQTPPVAIFVSRRMS